MCTWVIALIPSNSKNETCNKIGKNQNFRIKTELVSNNPPRSSSKFYGFLVIGNMAAGGFDMKPLFLGYHGYKNEFCARFPPWWFLCQGSGLQSCFVPTPWNYFQKHIDGSMQMRCNSVAIPTRWRATTARKQQCLTQYELFLQIAMD